MALTRDHGAPAAVKRHTWESCGWTAYLGARRSPGWRCVAGTAHGWSGGSLGGREPGRRTRPGLSMFAIGAEVGLFQRRTGEQPWGTWV